MYGKSKKLIKKFIPKTIFKSTVNYYHLLEALVANTKNGFPAKSMQFIGVTGTNGKTSTTVMIAAILEEAGFVVGMNTTAVIKDGKKTFENNLDGGLTNAGTFTMQKLLRRMKNNGVQWVAMETASQALDQHRLFGIDFEAAVITNLTDEHLDYHGTMERYAKSKAMLFKKSKHVSVTNSDDDWADYFKAIPAKKKVQYGRKAAAYKLIKISHTLKVTTVEFKIGGKNHKIKLKVQGEFNAYNALAAIAATHEIGVDIGVAKKALEKLERIPGRMDSIDAGQDFKVLVDYAHTPDAIDKVLSAAREITGGKLICITGAAGERPKSRRAPVGKIASKLSDILIVTDDEPFSEDPKKIREELKSGIISRKKLEVIEVPDRCKAMAEAFTIAKKGDTIVIAGMGHQKYRSGPNGKEPWDDAAVAHSVLQGKQHKYCKH